MAARQSRQAPGGFHRAEGAALTGIRTSTKPDAMSTNTGPVQGLAGEPVVGEVHAGIHDLAPQPAVVAERMQQGLPDAKLIVVLRNPVDRANSAMLHHVRRGRIAAGYRLVDIVNARQPAETDWFCLVSGGWYAASLEPFLDRFGDQLLVLLHDNVKTDPVATMKRRCATSAPSPDFDPGRSRPRRVQQSLRRPAAKRTRSHPMIEPLCGSAPRRRGAARKDGRYRPVAVGAQRAIGTSHAGWDEDRAVATRRRTRGRDGRTCGARARCRGHGGTGACAGRIGQDRRDERAEL